MNNLLKIREKINKVKRLNQAQLLAIKMEELLHIEGQSLEKESRKHKRKWN